MCSVPLWNYEVLVIYFKCIYKDIWEKVIRYNQYMISLTKVRSFYNIKERLHMFSKMKMRIKKKNIAKMCVDPILK